MKLTGTTPDGTYVEIVEIPDHPWFLGCQFHPEFKSKPLQPHPLFRAFIAAAQAHRQRRGRAAAEAVVPAESAAATSGHGFSHAASSAGDVPAALP
jgi:CTP synthase